MIDSRDPGSNAGVSFFEQVLHYLYKMKQLFYALSALLLLLASCENDQNLKYPFADRGVWQENDTMTNETNFKFGRNYNWFRKKMGSPLIKKNMVTTNCCGNWTIYKFLPAEGKTKAYHSTKTIRLIENGWLYEEKDIYRKNLNDTTLIQLNILSKYIQKDSTCTFKSNFGMIDKRNFEDSAEQQTPHGSSYTEYTWKNVEIAEADSLLKSWGLSRSDEY